MACRAPGGDDAGGGDAVPVAEGEKPLVQRRFAVRDEAHGRRAGCRPPGPFRN